jgi:hypothetical protein
MGKFWRIMTDSLSVRTFGSTRRMKLNGVALVQTIKFIKTLFIEKEDQSNWSSENQFGSHVHMLPLSK